MFAASIATRILLLTVPTSNVTLDMNVTKSHDIYCRPGNYWILRDQFISVVLFISYGHLHLSSRTGFKRAHPIRRRVDGGSTLAKNLFDRPQITVAWWWTTIFWSSH